MSAPHIVVVGGGIAGLAAAWELTQQGPDVRVTVCESAEAAGGKLATTGFADTRVDLAADAFLARRPEALDLCRELGLADELVAPATGRAFVWARGALRPLPDGQILGVPTSIRALADTGLLSAWGLARAAAEPLIPGRPLTGDEAVGTVIRRRFGTGVHQVLTDPLIGGINAGDTDQLSIDAVAPQLAGAARRHRSLGLGLRAGAATTHPPTGPVFLAHPGGMGHLVDVLVESLTARGVELRTSTPVATLTRQAGGGGYRLWGPDGEPVPGDEPISAVVLALPGAAAADVLGDVAPGPATVLGAITYTGVALVTMALPANALDHLPDGSGFLVPRREGSLMTACTWLSRKWTHHRPTTESAPTLIRVSAGRDGDQRALALDDDQLVAQLRVELARYAGVDASAQAQLVTRWPESFPQFRPGHLKRIEQVHATLARDLPGVALAGAVLGGVGIPACIGSGRAAARRVRRAVTPDTDP